MDNIKHIGIIPDGNRRWAIKNSLSYFSAYKKSMEHIAEVIEWVFDNNIQSLSIYLLSKENIERTREDLDAVLEAEEFFISNTLFPLCKVYDCKVKHAGNPNILPPQMKEELEKICTHTVNYKKHKLYLLLGYNPIHEINAALKQNNSKEIQIEDLYVSEKVDIVIRTAGGVSLLSNFLPLQCGYAQIYMIEDYFNDFNREQFESVCNQARNLKMLYGK